MKKSAKKLIKYEEINIFILETMTRVVKTKEPAIQTPPKSPPLSAER